MGVTRRVRIQKCLICESTFKSRKFLKQHVFSHFVLNDFKLRTYKDLKKHDTTFFRKPTKSVEAELHKFAIKNSKNLDEAIFNKENIDMDSICFGIKRSEESID
ncbi:unnamed protein product [Blepharisma stoltei]|uniref:C2H2-type domain-containing protein n=1 Tax=Blepharisma stoltei TaxID=1481888 RepID=A0AAU9IFE0_9CILI|nr:unnamed protein product [Blepharisma stoltei]